MAESKRIPRLKKDNLLWFDIKKYEGTKSWGVSDWAGAIMLRRMLMGITNRGEYVTKPTERTSLIFEEILCNPVMKKRYVGGLLAKGNSRIWDKTVIEVFDGRARLDHECYQDVVTLAENWYHQCNTEAHFPEIPALLNKGFVDLVFERFPTYSSYEEITVDLNASDAQLINDFKSWLAKKREVRCSGAPKRDISDADLQDWYRYRVLAFIDINLFCHFTDTDISQATLGNAIFPEEYDIDVSERIRKVVKPLVTRLMKNEFISSLDEQAARAERKSV